MTRQEAIEKLSTIGHISVSYAEDLYDSFFPKPIVPQCVADWIDVCKENLAIGLYTAMNPDFLKQWNKSDELICWIKKARNQDIFARAWVDGYEVEKEPRYTVRVKGINGSHQWLAFGKLTECWCFGGKENSSYVVLEHTRKELEDADFGWMFDCEGVEVKEVE
ncbi:MAG: DUF1642 domain-containing protein [Streptococcus salivarius]|nr:DUF1642 domain-containing protein [Streptococcus salivarius]MDU2859158.1 DUF1642 domain-containing protein [Streptococcus salivarius]DAS92379.1 MAG TPA: Protein of unknown function (DUF1642) [Caudoviricetes sp.]